MKMSGVLCLKWNNHSSSFIRILESLRLKELYCDVTIICSGKYYPVHRFVLSTCSEYFEDVFSRAPCKHPFIILKDIDHLQLEDLLNYMYKGEVNVTQDNLQAFIQAAEALQIKGLAVSDEEQNEICHKNNSNDVTKSNISEQNKTNSDLSSSELIPDETTDRDSQIPAEEDHVSEQLLNPETSMTDKPEADYKIPIVHCEEKNTSQDFEDQEMEVKNEPSDHDDPLDMDGDISNIGLLDGTENFTSMLDTTLNEDEGQIKTDSNLDIGLPQCSSWDDNPEHLTVEKTWTQVGLNLDSMSLDSFQYSMVDGSSSPDGGSGTKGSQISSKLKKHLCNECSFRTHDRAALRVHVMRRHTGERPFGCSFCDYRCTTRDMLKIHTRKHTGEKPFSCPYCNIKMAVKSRLKRHIILQHLRPRKSKPPSESDSSVLTVNTETPIGVLKMYRCTQCSYESQTKSNLNLHRMRIHTGEKPFSCSVCAYRTTTKSQLDRHMKKHTGERPFHCSFCSYKAAQKPSLLRHMSTHMK